MGHHGIKILVVDTDEAPAMALIGELDKADVEITIVKQTDRASANVRKTAYSLIILGDKLNGGGDTYDVGLQIKQSNVNKHTPVVIIARNMTRVGKLITLLRPYASSVDTTNEDDRKACATRIKDHFVSISPKQE